MDDWQKTIDALVKAFDEFAVKVKEMADALAEAFGFGPSVSENKRKKSLSSPARYGMSLRKSRRDSFVKQYSSGRLPGNTYLIREGIIENRPYKT